MKVIESLDGSAVKVFGDHSPHPIIATREFVAYYGGERDAFIAIQQLRNLNLLPRPYSNESYPYNMTDLKYILENVEEGYRKWKYGQLENCYEYIRGFYYEKDGVAHFSGGATWKL